MRLLFFDKTVEGGVKLTESVVKTFLGWDNSVDIVNIYGLEGPRIEPRVKARFSAPVQTGSGAYPISCTMGTGYSPGVKGQGRGVEHPSPFSAEVKEKVELYLYSTSGSLWLVIG